MKQIIDGVEKSVVILDSSSIVNAEQLDGSKLHVTVDSSVVTTVTGNVTVVQPTGSNLHVQLDTSNVNVVNPISITGQVHVIPDTSNVVVHGGTLDTIVNPVTVVQPSGASLHTVVDSGSISVTNFPALQDTNIKEIGGTVVSPTLYDTSSDSIKVTIVSGESSTAHTQVRDSSNTWTDVGYFPGDVNMPVQIQGTVPLPTGAATEATLAGIKTQTDKLTFDSSSNLKVTQTVVINDPIVVSGFDLQASAFSQSTTITNNYVFNSVQLRFTTAQVKTITITNSDGIILWGGTNDTSKNNLGYNTTAKTFNLVFDQVFSANDNITIAVTQTSGADLLTVRMITTLL